jgi:hypothetical protein
LVCTYLLHIFSFTVLYGYVQRATYIWILILLQESIMAIWRLMWHSFAGIKEWPFWPSSAVLCWWSSRCSPKCPGLVGWPCQSKHYVALNGSSIWPC